MEKVQSNRKWSLVCSPNSGYLGSHWISKVTSAVAGVGMRCDGKWHLRVYTVIREARLSPARPRKAERPKRRLQLCHAKCVQGVPGLALTTEQGSVFVHGSHLALFLYWHTVFSRASLTRRKAASMERNCGKANSTELFFGFWWSTAAFKCFKHGHWQTHWTWSFAVQLYIHNSPNSVSMYSSFYGLDRISFKVYILICLLKKAFNSLKSPSYQFISVYTHNYNRIIIISLSF